jgi:DNA gyrase inhibitor GyrI
VKITVDVRDGLDVSDALTRLAGWYSTNRISPEEYPMRGAIVYKDGMILFKRDYRKGDCFVVYQDDARKKELPTKEVIS